MQTIRVKIKKAEDAKDLPLPCYTTEGSSGMDIYAAVSGEFIINPREIKLVPAGFYLSIPAGYEAEIRPRSGLALKHGITIANSPGTIDSDYRGLVCIIVTNLGKEPYAIKRGDRIAQMVFKETVNTILEPCEELDETTRAAGGFGHTGLRVEGRE
jgi:dUTP pyrophosphatase